MVTPIVLRAFRLPRLNHGATVGACATIIRQNVCVPCSNQGDFYSRMNTTDTSCAFCLLFKTAQHPVALSSLEKTGTESHCIHCCTHPISTMPCGGMVYGCWICGFLCRSPAIMRIHLRTWDGASLQKCMAPPRSCVGGAPAYRNGHELGHGSTV